MATATDQKQLVLEHIKLQNEFREYVAKNGFDYGQYSAPKPGSFYDTYRKRWLDLTHQITKPLHGPNE